MAIETHHSIIFHGVWMESHQTIDPRLLILKMEPNMQIIVLVVLHNTYSPRINMGQDQMRLIIDRMVVERLDFSL